MENVIYTFQQHGDSRGQLIALEENKEIPFSVKRIYYIFDTTQGVTRGFHAHKTLEQVLICVHGSCKIRMDDGFENTVEVLDTPYRGLYVGPGMWHEMFDFSDDAILLCIASGLYDESDYIRDYSQFLKYKGAISI